MPWQRRPGYATWTDQGRALACAEQYEHRSVSSGQHGQTERTARPLLASNTPLERDMSAPFAVVRRLSDIRHPKADIRLSRFPGQQRTTRTPVFRRPCKL
jgi:hypothetical protein